MLVIFDAYCQNFDNELSMMFNVGKYKMEYYSNVQTFNVNAFYYEKDIYSETNEKLFFLKVEAAGDDDGNKKVTFELDSRFINRFQELLIEIRYKFIEWQADAVKRNLKDKSKDFGVRLSPINTYGAGYDVYTVERLNALFKVGKSGRCAVVLYCDNCHVDMNRKENDIYMVFLSTEEFDNFINLFDYHEIYENIMTTRVNKESSDRALQELEKWKKKLDLQIITQEEYDKKKEELMKYID